MVAHGFRTDRWHITGAVISLIGVAVIIYAPNALRSASGS
jgi:drug/metabolite transporter superfamily protein YnfA